MKPIVIIQTPEEVTIEELDEFKSLLRQIASGEVTRPLVSNTHLRFFVISDEGVKLIE